MSKKRVKLAVIRSPGDTLCPFGLPIPYACKHAGKAVTRMAPIEVLGDEPSSNEVKQLIKANKTVMTMEADGTRCPYAGKVFSEKKAVECNFGSNAEGISEEGLTGSPFYSKVYDNIAYDGLYSYPMGWYGDSNISRNLYYGAYSLQGSDENRSMEKTSGDVVDMSGRFQQRQEQTEQEKIREQFEGASPQSFEQPQQDDLERARQRGFLSEVQQESGVWMHRFSDVRKDDKGFYIFRNDNEAGSKMVPGHVLADFAMNQTPYWRVTSVDGERINLEPIGSNPFLTGVGAGGAKLTDFDIQIFTGEAERQKVEQISKKISDGDATIDDVKYLLDGTVPLQMGPNGGQGGWYNANDRNNRGGRKGMGPQEVMMSDARKLQDWGFQVPAAAISGELDVSNWGRWLEGNGDSDIDYVPKNMDAWVDYHRKMTEKGKWRYDEERLEDMRRSFSLEKTQEYHEQIMQDFMSMEKAFFKKKYPHLSGFDNLRDLTQFFKRQEEGVKKRLEKQDVYLTEGEDSSEESVIKNVFSKERRVAIRNTVKLINMAREDSSYVKYLHDMMKMGGSDWFANEKVIKFFEEIEDTEGLKYALEKLKDPTNRRYAYAAMARLAPDEAADFVTEDDSLEAIRGLIYGYIDKNSPEYGQKMDQEESYKHMTWVQEFAKKHSLIDKIKENINSRDFKDKHDAEELLGSLRSAIKKYTPATWLGPEQVKEHFPQFYDFIMEVRSVE